MVAKQYTYKPDFFEPENFEHAKRIVIGYGNIETPDKWIEETKWIIELLANYNFLNTDSIVVDWGVGVGRVAKEIIDTFGCKVIGVDINESMLAYATEYCNSPNFIGISPSEFQNYTGEITNAISIWALQHSITVQEDLDIIKSKLTPTGRLFIFEARYRTIPVERPADILDGPTVRWAIGDKSNFYLIDKLFKIEDHGSFPERFNMPENEDSWWGFFKNKI